MYPSRTTNTPQAELVVVCGCILGLHFMYCRMHGLQLLLEGVQAKTYLHRTSVGEALPCMHVQCSLYLGVFFYEAT